MHVRSVEPGERVTFEWWTDDDATDRSHVELEVVRDGSRTALRVTETFARTGAASAHAEVAWDVRLLVLHLASCALARRLPADAAGRHAVGHLAIWIEAERRQQRV